MWESEERVSGAGRVVPVVSPSKSLPSLVLVGYGRTVVLYIGQKIGTYYPPYSPATAHLLRPPIPYCRLCRLLRSNCWSAVLCML